MRRSLRGGLPALAGVTTATILSLSAPSGASAPPALDALRLPDLVPTLALRPAATPRPHRRRLVHPVRGRVSYGEATARFGAARPGHVHAGQDVFAPAGTPLAAVADSIVVDAGSGDARGNHIALYDPRARRTYVYFHMLRPARLRVGRHVRAGRIVGRVGCTGRCFGDHLHFEIHRGRGADGAPLDPLPRLRRWGAGRRGR